MLDAAIGKNSLDVEADYLVWTDGKAREVTDDAKKAAKEAIQGVLGNKKKKKMAIPPVDPNCSYAEEGSILVENDEVYAVTLNLVRLILVPRKVPIYYLNNIIITHFNKFHYQKICKYQP